MYESESEVAQSCPTLCNPVDCSLPGSSVHGILQARILEWVAISFSRGSSRPRDQTQVSHIGGGRFNLWATREAHQLYSVNYIGIQLILTLVFHEWENEKPLKITKSVFPDFRCLTYQIDTSLCLHDSPVKCQKLQLCDWARYSLHSI